MKKRTTRVDDDDDGNGGVNFGPGTVVNAGGDIVGRDKVTIGAKMPKVGEVVNILANADGLDQTKVEKIVRYLGVDTPLSALSVISVEDNFELVGITAAELETAKKAAKKILRARGL